MATSAKEIEEQARYCRGISNKPVDTGQALLHQDKPRLLTFLCEGKPLEDHLRRESILDQVNEFAASVDPEKYPAVDIGWGQTREGIMPMVAFRWSPKVDDGIIVSKAVGVYTSKSLHRVVTVFATRQKEGEESPTRWDYLHSDVPARFVGENVRLAMLNADARIRDNRTRVGRRYIGKPGVGRI